MDEAKELNCTISTTLVQAPAKAPAKTQREPDIAGSGEAQICRSDFSRDALDLKTSRLKSLPQGAAENRTAIDAYNAFVQAQGVFSDSVRSF